jgi:hypothetical protein
MLSGRAEIPDARGAIGWPLLPYLGTMGEKLRSSDMTVRLWESPYATTPIPAAAEGRSCS